MTHADAPAWLLQLTRAALAALALGLAALAASLAAGWADPPRAGPLRWETDFKAGAAGWVFSAPPGGTLAPRQGALVAELDAAGPGAWAVALAPEPAAGDFTLEVAGASATPASASAYGLIFAWDDSDHYSVLLINAHGYAEAYRQDGPRRDTWFAWQQWPHILVGTDNNRLRLDARGDRVTLRVNDEVVVSVAGTATAGRVGLTAQAAAAPNPAGALVFSWARLWAATPPP